MKTESRLEKVLAAGHFAVTAECGPPKGADEQHWKPRENPFWDTSTRST